MDNMQKLLDIMAALRDPNTGCPWDKAQTFQTIAPYTIEEAYEVADAIESGDPQELVKELGDLLFQVVFYSQIAREKQLFDFNDVVNSISEKMIRRHPHVFGDAQITTAEQQTEHWEKIKQAERSDASKQQAASALDGITATLPALTRAKKLQSRARNVGFDWDDIEGVQEKLFEEFLELKQAHEENDPQHVMEELGDLMFVCVNLARHVKTDPEQAMRYANAKFEKRFRKMEEIAALARKTMSDYTMPQLDDLWQQAKRST